jgi:hypothetical protein
MRSRWTGPEALAPLGNCRMRLVTQASATMTVFSATASIPVLVASDFQEAQRLPSGSAQGVALQTSHEGASRVADVLAHALGLKHEEKRNSKEWTPPAHLLSKYNRAELYEKVWSQPMRILAQQYGVSDAYLGRVCRLLRIPLPGLGYWAKKERRKDGEEASATASTSQRGQPARDQELNIPFGRSNVSNAKPAIFGFLTPNAGVPEADQTTWRAICQDRVLVSGALQRQRNLSDECFIFSLRFAEAPVRSDNSSPQLSRVKLRTSAFSSNLARKKWRLEGNTETGETLAEEVKIAKSLSLQDFPILEKNKLTWRRGGDSRPPLRTAL